MATSMACMHARVVTKAPAPSRRCDLGKVSTASRRDFARRAGERDMSAADRPHYISSDAEDMVNSYDEEAPHVRPLLLCPRSMLRHVNTASLGAIADALQAEAETLRILSADHWQVDRRSTPDLITLWPAPESTWTVVEGAFLHATASDTHVLTGRRGVTCAQAPCRRTGRCSCSAPPRMAVFTPCLGRVTCTSGEHGRAL